MVYKPLGSLALEENKKKCISTVKYEINIVLELNILLVESTFCSKLIVPIGT